MGGTTTLGNSIACADGSGPSQRLPNAVQTQILSLLSPNERALSGRLVSMDAAGGLCGPENCTASLSQPLPPHAAAWAVEAGQQHVRQLHFRHRLQLLCTAAASGSEANLEVALALLQPSVFPEVLQLPSSECRPDPGLAALEAGHPQLLGWLLRHCPGLMCRGEVLAAAARHCDLGGLQATWKALQAHPGTRASSSLHSLLTSDVLAQAAVSPSPDAVAKMEWVLATAGSSCSMERSTAAAAARSGDLARLRWLRNLGCPMEHGAGRAGEEDVLPARHGQVGVLTCALQHADLAVAPWLVDEAGCGMPAAGGGGTAAEEGNSSTWTCLMQAAAKSPDAVAKWQWLQERGGPTWLSASESWALQLTLAAIKAGQVEAVRYLLSVFGSKLQLDPDKVSVAAASSGSVAMAELLRQTGFVFTHAAYDGAARASSLSMVRWLAQEARVSAAPLEYYHLFGMTVRWPEDSLAHSRDLLEAVQLVVGAGFSNWEDRPNASLASAAYRGDLALAQYLLQQNALYHPSFATMRAATKAGCEPLLEFLTSLPGCATPRGSDALYITAAWQGDLATLDALRRLGAPLGGEGVVAKAVQKRCGESALRWLVEHGAPVGSAEKMEKAVRRAVKRGRLGAEAAAWLRGLVAGGSGAGSDGKE